MTITCNVIFENLTGAYYSGQTIQGRIEVNVAKETKLNGIELTCKGKCTVSWNETVSYYDHNLKRSTTRNQKYSGHEEYFRFLQQCPETGTTAEQKRIAPGKYTYPFVFVLPPILPSSFEGTRGNIRYMIRVKCRRPYKSNKKFGVVFNVMSPVNLNADQSLMVPIKEVFDKNLYMCCVSSGRLTCVVQIFKRGYVAGEVINSTIEIDNNSKVNVQSVRIQVVQTVAYTSLVPHRKTVEETNVVAKSLGDPVTKGQSKTWNQLIPLPSTYLPPSNVLNCSLIAITYHLEVRAHVSGMHTDLKGVIPIMIGTIPLVEQYNASAPPDTPAYAAPSYTFQNDLPPAYSEIDPCGSQPIPSGDSAHTNVVSGSTSQGKF